MSRAVLSLGSNLGDRYGFLRQSIIDLANALVAVSSVYETKPWGVTDQPDFFNAVCIVDDPAKDHRDWLAEAQALERQAGRVRAAKWGPRTLDVDIITVDGVISTDPDLLLPHPGTPHRATVLIPWHEIEPDAELPGHGSIRGLLATLPRADRADVVLRPELVLGE